MIIHLVMLLGAIAVLFIVAAMFARQRRFNLIRSYVRHQGQLELSQLRLEGYHAVPQGMFLDWLESKVVLKLSITTPGGAKVTMHEMSYLVMQRTTGVPHERYDEIYKRVMDELGKLNYYK